MVKKSIDYSNLLTPKGTAKASTGVQTRPEPSSNEEIQQLNLKVPAALKREIKVYATEHDLTMTELLQRAFEVYKANNP